MSMYSMEDIARFAEGDMTPEEQSLFEEALQSDTELQSSLSFYRNVHSSLKMKLSNDKKDEEFKESLRRISNKHFNKDAKVITMRRYIIWTSAIAAMFVLFLIWAPWHKNLYQQYSGTEMLVMTERSDSSDKLILDAATAFNKKDFVTARQALKRIYDAEPNNTMAQYYYGITLLETGETQASRQVLSRIYTGVSIFKYDAAFYMALSYVKEKDNQQARKWLAKIPADAANYDKSQELLKKIK